MDREEFIEKKQTEIQEEVDFLRMEKRDARREADKLYDEIRDKITELRYCVSKEESSNKRLESIDKFGSDIYGIHVSTNGITMPYTINSSLYYLQTLAKDEFNIEEFGGLPEEKEELVKFKSAQKLQEENNALMLELIETIKEVGDNNTPVNVSSAKLLSEGLSNKYNGGLN